MCLYTNKNPFAVICSSQSQMALEESNILTRKCCLLAGISMWMIFDLNKITFKNCLSRYDWNVDIHPKKRHDRRKMCLDSEIQPPNEREGCALLYVPVCLRYVFLQTHRLNKCHLKNITLWVQEARQAVPEVNWDS